MPRLGSALQRAVRGTLVVLGALGVLAWLAWQGMTGTAAGRRWIGRLLEAHTGRLLAGRGTLRVVAVDALGAHRIRLRGVSLLDSTGHSVVSVDSVDGRLAVVELSRRVIRLESLRLTGVRLAFRQDAVGRPWNIAHLILGEPTLGVVGAPGFGDAIRVDTLRVARVALETVMPWTPHPIFRGAARDSVIAVRDSLHDLTATGDGRWFERRTVQLMSAVAHEVILADPTRRRGMLLDSLTGVLSDPALRVQQARGRLEWTSDSLALALDHVALPDSRGSAIGRLSWDQPGPLRFDVSVSADAALRELQWAWEALPTEGRGRARVRMRTLADPYDAEYVLDSLTLLSGPSRASGRVAVVVRPADLLLHQVDLRVASLTDTLARRLSYGALPAGLTGTFDGRIEATTGGSMLAPDVPFVVDRLALDFRSARGAAARIGYRGTVLMGTDPGVRNANLELTAVEVPLIREFLPNPDAWSALDGRVTGQLRIRSADARALELADSHLEWRDAAGHSSHVTTQGRLRYANPKHLEMDLVAQLDTLDVRALARIDTTIRFHPTIAGRFTARGPISEVHWTAALRAIPSDTANDVVAQGQAAWTDSGWRVQADGALTAVDLHRWLARTNIPATAINGSVHVVAEGGGADRVLREASLVVMLNQGDAADRPAISAHGAASWSPERIVLDSLISDMGGVHLTATGRLPRYAGSTDTLRLTLHGDSLATLSATLPRLGRLWRSVDSTQAAAIVSLAADSVDGTLDLSAVVTGNLDELSAETVLHARRVQLGGARAAAVDGVAHVDHLTREPVANGSVTVNRLDALGSIRIDTLTLAVRGATRQAGEVALELHGTGHSALRSRLRYARSLQAEELMMDSLRLRLDRTIWQSERPVRLRIDSTAIDLSSMILRASDGGLAAVEMHIPADAPMRGSIELQRFPVGEVASLLAGAPDFHGTVSGRGTLAGARRSPVLNWSATADSIGLSGVRLPAIRVDAAYQDRAVSVAAGVRDSLGGTLSLTARIPVDLRLERVEKRLLEDRVAGRLRADSLRFEGLGGYIEGVEGLRGMLDGTLAVGGTFERPVADGMLQLDGVTARVEPLGITMTDGRMTVRANADSLVLEGLRVRSGGVRDTIGARGVVHVHEGKPAEVQLRLEANAFQAARQRDGTDVDVSGEITLSGVLARPTLSGRVAIPRATLVVDPLGARAALDLASPSARALLGVSEVPIAESAAQTLSSLGPYLRVEGARVELLNDVWVQTPEARVKLGGALDIAMQNDRLALDGEIRADRGQYRLDLGPVSRSFAVDSGRVRFFGEGALAPTLDIQATHVVRVAGGGEIPIRVRIGGSYERPSLTLSSSDPLYASAPESEIISLLLFGAPTFALDGERQGTVQAVTGVLVRSVGGAVEGALQRLLPVFNTVQVSTAGRQGATDLTVFSLLDNLSIAAGKQVGERTFLRLNTGVCRSAGQAALRGASFWYGLAAEYRLAPNLTGQLGVDPGVAPCTRLGGDMLPRLQFGFDLFREWIW